MATFSATLASNAFTPPDNSLVVVLSGSDNSSGTNTCTSSPSVTWTSGAALANGNATVGIHYHYYAVSPGSLTVTSGNSGGSGLYQDIRVVVNVNPTQAGVSTTLVVNSSTVFNKALTPTRTGGLIYGMGMNGSSTAALTVIAGFTALNSNAGTFGYFASGTAAVITPVSTSYGWTLGSGLSGAIALLEILSLSPNTSSNNFVPMIRSAFI